MGMKLSFIRASIHKKDKLREPLQVIFFMLCQFPFFCRIDLRLNRLYLLTALTMQSLEKTLNDFVLKSFHPNEIIICMNGCIGET